MSELAQKQTMIKPSPIIQMSNTLSTLEHKLYNGLLYIAREKLKDQRLRTLFHVEFSQLKDLLKLEYESNIHLKQNLKKLATTTVEYNILGKDTEEWGIFALVSLVKFKTTKNNCIITFQLPEPIVQALLDNKLYAKLQLRIIRGIQSKYALILYELARDYERAQIPEMTIEEFRKIFGIVGKYKNFAELRRNVLDPAIEELNKNENIDFLVSYKLKKRGNKYTHIKFIIRKKAQKQQQKQVQGQVQQKIRGVINTKQNTQQQVQQMDRKKQVELEKKLVRMLAKGITNGLVDIESVLINLSVEYGRDVLAYSLGRIRNDTNILKQLRLAGSESAVEEILDMQCRYIVENVKMEEIQKYTSYMIRKYILGGKNEAKTKTQKTGTNNTGQD